MQLLKDFIKDESGATAIEYGLIAGLIAVVIIGTLTTLGGNISGLFDEISQGIKDAKKAGTGTGTDG
ncbi:MAG: Flp family type IVb pilin [Alcaligenaceae bacterium]|nr:Flp family type IVb pilin [Alcaligenaceae bacterium]